MIMNMSHLIQTYLDSKALAWSPTTLKSERHRLNAITAHLTGDPMVLWAALQGHKPYSRLTVWIRVTSLWQWLLNKGHVTGGNPYQVFRDENARLFKNAYQKQTPDISFEDAKARIAQMPNAESRAKAMQLLCGGLRYTESLNVEAGHVVGKGGKHREVYVGSCDTDISYQTLRRHLAAVGLKPHMLRKLFATQLVAAGANEFDLCSIMGWSSIQTATSYVKASSSKARRLVATVQGEDTNDSTESIPAVLQRQRRPA